ncbi:MAG TPA: hydrogenase formation protein HypD [Verrucomicrobiae bacterium]|nr:hydrogenase formation protein HypD [Verrucomicrobiae bacterium]
MNTKLRAQQLLAEIRDMATEPFKIMEVCGSHTVAIAKSGVRELLPVNVQLVSGPGCPVCVTDNSDIDRFLELAQRPGVIITTFGDMLRVPGSKTTLQAVRAEGADIRIIYSTLDALEIARQNPTKEVVFLGVGFETTIPTVAVSIELALKEGLKNYSVMSMHKLVPPALELLATDPELGLDAFINPGHVCSVLGTQPFEFMAEKYHKPSVVGGFEPLDILEAIWMLLKQRTEKRAEVEIQYFRVVKKEGNPRAVEYMNRYFTAADVFWRGMGLLPQSGLKIRAEYAEHDAEVKFGMPEPVESKIPGCMCGDILKGRVLPFNCPLFGKGCTPLKPIGPCMVSSEGSCAAYYRYSQRRG